jgi:hypothetical protein
MGLKWATAICLAVALGPLSGACQEQPRSKIIGWPPADPLAGPQAPEVVAASSAPAPTAPAPVAVGPCQEVLIRACELLGRHSEECAAARGRLPLDLAPAEEAVCTRALERAAEQERPVLNPCWELAKRQCADLGKATQLCQEARAWASRFRKPAERLPCAGDIWLWEIREVLTARAGGA